MDSVAYSECLGEICWQASYSCALRSRDIWFTFPGLSLSITSCLYPRTTEPALPTDDGPTQVSGLPARRVPEPVAPPRELFEPERRRVEREIHPWPIASPMIARHARSIYYYAPKRTYIAEKCTISLACRLHHSTRPWTEPGRVVQDPSSGRFTCSSSSEPS
jgi:hypothetical protein